MSKKSKSKILCLNCQVFGHSTKNCPNSNRCKSCGKQGHVNLNCPSKLTKKDKDRQKTPEKSKSKFNFSTTYLYKLCISENTDSVIYCISVKSIQNLHFLRCKAKRLLCEKIFEMYALF